MGAEAWKVDDIVITSGVEVGITTDFEIFRWRAVGQEFKQRVRRLLLPITGAVEPKPGELRRREWKRIDALNK